MDAAADLFRNLEHDIIGLHWLLEHRPEQVRLFDDRGAQVGTGNDIYFAGEAEAPGVSEALRRLPATASIHAPRTWLGAINDAWAGKVSRLQCTEWKRTSREAPRPIGPSSVVVSPLSGPMLQRLHETGLERLIQPYRGPEEFLRLSFGFAVVQQHKVVSACTAFYIAGGAADLATETYTSLRNNGYGALVLRGAVQESLRRGLQPQVHASACNSPMAHLVRKLGFDEPASYEIFARQM